MPETQNFYASGKGNGFPFCLDSATKVDVSFNDYWTTLSGYNKTHADAGISVTQEQIFASLVNASKLFWNTYGITGTASAAFAHDGPSSYSHSIANVSVDDQDDLGDLDDQENIPVPRERVCLGPYPLAERIVQPTLSPSNSLFISMFLRLTKLYNGSISDDGNFVGYGMPIATIGAEAPSADCIVRLHYSADDLGFPLRDQSVGYVELYGMHFVANCYVETFEAIFTSSTSLSPLSASITVNTEPGRFAFQSDASAEITSLDFYTYT